MGGRKARRWCDICRDEKPDVNCCQRDCRKGFHIECLRNTNQLYENEDLANYMCPGCRNNEDNDAFCYKCKSEGNENSILLMCDGCTRSAHLECIGLDDVPSSEIWLCPICEPAKQVTPFSMEDTTQKVARGGKAKLGNVDICYVCQKGGKLLCCDCCDQSFHPKCIDPEFLEGTFLDEGTWNCPICRGEDPLKTMGHKRLTRMERQEKSRQWQDCVRRESRRCKANRDMFLFELRHALKPFISSDVMARLRRSATAAMRQKQKQAAAASVKSGFLKPQPAKARDLLSESSQSAEESDVGPAKNDVRCQSEDPDESSQSSDRYKRRKFAGSQGVSLSRVKKQQYLSRRRRHISSSEDDDKSVGSDDPDRTQTSQRAEPTDPKGQDVDSARSQFQSDDRSPVSEVPQTLSQGPSPKVESELTPHLTEVKSESEKPACPKQPPEIDSHVVYKSEDLLKEAEDVAKDQNATILREGVELKHYQRWGVNWLLDAFNNKAGAILADEMGLGKTIQALAFLCALKVLGITGPHLVVVPLSTVGNWAREIRKCTKNLTVAKICGSRQEREHAMSDGVAMDGIYDIFITTYETAVTEEWFFTDQFKWQCVILDEAHRIKNESARIRHSLDRVECNMRILLTGTPLQNNIKELFTLLNFLFPDIFKNSSMLEAAFASAQPTTTSKRGFMGPKTPDRVATEPNGSETKPGRKPGSGTDPGEDKKTGAQTMEEKQKSQLIFNPMSVIDEDKVESLTFLLSKLMLRRTKDLVIRLPPKIEHDIWLPLSPMAALWYRRLLETTTNDVDSDSSIRKLLGAVIKMRICCCHPRGLVSRGDQFKNFIKTLHEKFIFDEATLKQEAEELKAVTNGWKHICYSTKLCFLDKLLRQLHSENMTYCSAYKQEFLARQEVLKRQVTKAKKQLLEDYRVQIKMKYAEDEVPSNVAEIVFNLEEDLRILELPADQGGGLQGLIKDPAALAHPSQQAEVFVKDLYAVPQQPSVLETPLVHEPCGKTASLPRDPSNPSSSGPKSPHDFEDQNYSQAELLGDGSDDCDNPPPLSTQPRPHKVLVFTQFQLILDELSAYCEWRGWNYMRLDGSTNKMIRELDTREFNNFDSNCFIYLISTRAGGLGINLVTANHVVMYDEDWNPFVDLQAVDRAHRIGQVRAVHIWRLMLEWTVEERMAIRRQQKLRLDRLLIQANVAEEILDDDAGVQDPFRSGDKLSTDEIRRLIQYGRTALMRIPVTNEIENMTLEAIMDRKRKELRDLVDMDLAEEEEVKSQEGSEEEVIDLRETFLSTQDLCQGQGGVDDLAMTAEEDEDESDDEALNPSKDEEKVPKDKMLPATDAANEDRELDSTPTETLELSATKTDYGSVSQEDVKQEGFAGSDDQSQDDLASEAAVAGLLYMEARPKRERRKPKNIYNPTLQVDRCGAGGQLDAILQQGSVLQGETKAHNRHKKEEDPPSSCHVPELLVGCMRCPKVYHLESCLGLKKKPSRTWICPWHECYLCFRRAAAAGGLLIHCAECPTAFCFDCFPPEYRRYTPPPQFFEDIQKRGWNIDATKFVTFLCSKCKAFKEQERRRHLTMQQLEAEMRQRKTKDDLARSETRRRQQQSKEERMLAKDRKKKLSDERKEFARRKKEIDQLDKLAQDQFRAAIEGLYPKAYVDLLEQRRRELLSEYQNLETEGKAKSADSAPGDAATVAADDRKSECLVSISEPPSQTEATEETEATSMLPEDIPEKPIQPSPSSPHQSHPEDTTEIPDPAHSEPLDPKMGLDPDFTMTSELDQLSTEKEPDSSATKPQGPQPKIALSKSKRLVIPDRLRSPGETFKLCENCAFPLHDINQCPYPLELLKQKVDVKPVAKRSAPTLSETPCSMIIEMSDNDTKSVSTPAKLEPAESGLNTEDSSKPAPSPIEDSEKEAVHLTPTSASVAPDPQDLQTNDPLFEDTAKDAKATGEADPSASPVKASKARYRYICSLCKETSGIPHARKHCERQTEEIRKEYAERRKKYQELIKYIELAREVTYASEATITSLIRKLQSGDEDASNEPATEPIKLDSLFSLAPFKLVIPSRLSDLLSSHTLMQKPLSDRFLDGMKRQLNCSVEDLLHSLMRKADLAKCLPAPKKKPKYASGDAFPSPVSGQLIKPLPPPSAASSDAALSPSHPPQAVVVGRTVSDTEPPSSHVVVSSQAPLLKPDLIPVRKRATSSRAEKANDASTTSGPCKKVPKTDRLSSTGRHAQEPSTSEKSQVHPPSQSRSRKVTGQKPSSAQKRTKHTPKSTPAPILIDDRPSAEAPDPESSSARSYSVSSDFVLPSQSASLNAGPGAAGHRPVQHRSGPGLFRGESRASNAPSMFLSPNPISQSNPYAVGVAPPNSPTFVMAPTPQTTQQRLAPEGLSHAAHLQPGGPAPPPPTMDLPFHGASHPRPALPQHTFFPSNNMLMAAAMLMQQHQFQASKQPTSPFPSPNFSYHSSNSVHPYYFLQPQFLSSPPISTSSPSPPTNSPAWHIMTSSNPSNSTTASQSNFHCPNQN